MVEVSGGFRHSLESPGSAINQMSSPWAPDHSTSPPRDKGDVCECIVDLVTTPQQSPILCTDLFILHRIWNQPLIKADPNHILLFLSVPIEGQECSYNI